ncbi:hypothetical protein PTKIN_Ptkin09bG0052000 [Pterospermum kingtungense]
MDPLSKLNIISSEIGADGDSDQPAAATGNITRMDVALYKATVRGELEAFSNYQGFQLQSLRTRNDNTVLHVYLATGKYEVPLFLMAFWLRSPFNLIRRGHFLSSVRIRNWELKTSFIEQILNKCPSLLLQPNAKGQTPLHIAARYDHSTIVRFLINHRAKSSHGDRENQRNEFEAVREMLRKTDKESNTALHVAVERGHLQVVKELLDLEDPDFPYSANKNEETPLYIAARRGYHSLLTTILHKFKSAAHGGPNGRTALHAAAMAGNKKATRIILEKKGNLTKETDENGQTPLHYAAHLGNYSLVKVLLEWDKSAAYVRDKKLEMTPLLMAARQGHLQIVCEIISCCPDCCEMVDNKGWNFLHFLAFRVDTVPKYRLIQFPKMWKIITNEYIPDLRDQKDFSGITPRQLLAAYRGRLTAEKPSLEETKKREEIAKLLEDIEKEEVAEVPVKPTRYEVRFPSASSIEKAKEPQLVVAALIATVTFAAAITVPGGYKNDKGPDQGTPYLIRDAAFEAFVISDALAFMFSLTACWEEVGLASLVDHVAQSLESCVEWLCKTLRSLGERTVGKVNFGDMCLYWRRAPEGFLKCNLDAAFFFNEGLTGFGYVLRDSEGALVGGLTRYTYYGYESWGLGMLFLRLCSICGGCVVLW